MANPSGTGIPAFVFNSPRFAILPPTWSADSLVSSVSGMTSRSSNRISFRPTIRAIPCVISAYDVEIDDHGPNMFRYLEGFALRISPVKEIFTGELFSEIRHGRQRGVIVVKQASECSEPLPERSGSVRSFGFSGVYSKHEFDMVQYLHVFVPFPAVPAVS